jgi:hypothetical protein
LIAGILVGLLMATLLLAWRLARLPAAKLARF